MSKVSEIIERVEKVAEGYLAKLDQGLPYNAYHLIEDVIAAVKGETVEREPELPVVEPEEVVAE